MKRKNWKGEKGTTKGEKANDKTSKRCGNLGRVKTTSSRIGGKRRRWGGKNREGRCVFVTGMVKGYKPRKGKITRKNKKKKREEGRV